MIINIRQAMPQDAEEIGYVHYTSWLETYSGLINTEFLGLLSPEESAKKFREENLDNTLVLTADDQIVGFSVTGPTRNEDLPKSFGDIHDIYILKQFQKMGLGKKLLEAAMDQLRLEGCEDVAIWVLGTNTASNEFFEKNGFVFDGTQAEFSYVTPVVFGRFLRTKSI